MESSVTLREGDNSAAGGKLEYWPGADPATCSRAGAGADAYCVWAGAGEYWVWAYWACGWAYWVKEGAGAYWACAGCGEYWVAREEVCCVRLCSYPARGDWWPRWKVEAGPPVCICDCRAGWCCADPALEELGCRWWLEALWDPSGV